METCETEWTQVHEVARFQRQYGGSAGSEYTRFCGMSWRYAAYQRALAQRVRPNDRQIARRIGAPPQGGGGVYSLYMTPRTEECDWYEQQIGGESPDPGPERREPDTEETRA